MKVEHVNRKCRRDGDPEKIREESNNLNHIVAFKLDLICSK